MKSIIILLVAVTLISCGFFKKNPQNSQSQDSIQAKIHISKNNEAWSYVIADDKVGLITLNTKISDVAQTLPENHSISEHKLFLDGDDEESFSNALLIREGVDEKFYIIADELDSDKIQSIIVIDPQYKLANTNICVGMSIKDLLGQITVKDTYFNIADGLYIIPKEFSCSFKINLQGFGEYYESLDKLPNNCYVERVVISRATPAFSSVDFRVPNCLDSMRVFKEQILNNKSNCNLVANANTTVALIDSTYIGSGVDSTLRFHSEMLNIGDVKVIAFSYLRDCHNLYHPAIELQSFDSKNNFIDQLLVAFSIFEEGGGKERNITH